MSFFQKPQVQAILWRLCGASGAIGMALAKLCVYFGLPVPDPSMTTLILTGALTWLAETAFTWYRDNPNNMLRKLVCRINGTDINGETKAIVAEAMSNVPGVKVAVDTTAASPAPLAVKALALNEDKAPDVVSQTGG